MTGEHPDTAFNNEIWVRTEWPGFIPDKADKEFSFSPPEFPAVGMSPIKACSRSRTTVTIRIQRGASCSPVFIKPWCRHTSSVPLNCCVRSYVSFPKLMVLEYVDKSQAVASLHQELWRDTHYGWYVSNTTPMKPNRTSYWEVRK